MRPLTSKPLPKAPMHHKKAKKLVGVKRLGYLCVSENMRRRYSPRTGNRRTNKTIRTMRIVIQRVSRASVTIGQQVKSSIGKGFLILLGICEDDGMEDVEWLARKVVALRVFDDENGVMNRPIQDVNGDIIVVSQFTLMASYKKGNRPSWLRAARHEVSVPLYEAFCARLSEELGKPVGTGEFGADMKVELVNDGPVTICMDTKNKE